jgi:hypothetical protein
VTKLSHFILCQSLSLDDTYCCCEKDFLSFSPNLTIIIKLTMKLLLKKAMFGSAVFALCSTSAMAAWTFSSADLVIGFQATGGQGSTTNLFFNVGDSYTFNTSSTPYGIVGNINDDLTATYGANWASRSDLYFGAFANRSNLTPTLEPATPGATDQGATLYFSAPTVNVGDAALRSAIGTSSRQTAGTQFAGLRTNLANFTETAFGDGVAALNQAAMPVEWNNSWTVRNPTPGAAFATLTGGIQQSFGQAGLNNIVDIQRMSTAADGGVSYVGSILISDNGSITVIPEPSSSLIAIAAGALTVFRRRRNA